MKKHKKTGVVSKEDIQTPSQERLEEGPVAVIECVEEIPCDPCVATCPQDAISMGNITDTPNMDFDDCIGCGLCVTECPGLAIFMLDCSGEGCEVTVPYEYLPVPEKGDTVRALDRKGVSVQKAEVTSVRSSGRTYAITMKIDRENVWDVRGLEVEG